MEEYFPNAEQYIPERWIKGDAQESHHHPYVVLPFGFGTRMCIGRKIVELEIQQLVIKVRSCLIAKRKLKYNSNSVSLFSWYKISKSNIITKT